MLRIDGIDVMLIKIQGIGIFQEESQTAVIQTAYGQFRLLQCLQGLVGYHPEISSVTFEKHQIVEALNDKIIGTEGGYLGDPRLFHFHTCLQLILTDQSAFIGAFQCIQLPVL